jgi:hypothetical protein
MFAGAGASVFVADPLPENWPEPDVVVEPESQPATNNTPVHAAARSDLFMTHSERKN